MNQFLQTTQPLDGVQLIARERLRQINEEGWSKERDGLYVKQELAMAATCYAAPINCYVRSEGFPPMLWPWMCTWWKPGDGGIEGRIRELTKAGALIAAEIDRLQIKLDAGQKDMDP